jgi:putative cardiolipin synthase
MDVLAAGPIVAEVSEAFDLYWNDELAYPVEALGASGDPALLQKARERLQQEVETLSASAYGRRLRESTLAEELQDGTLDFAWATAELLVDLPEKVLTDPEDRSTHLGPELEELLGSAQRRLTLISPYFVPGRSGSRQLTALAERDVQVTVVTNSLASTDVPAVHSGYAPYRRRLLQAGIELYEVRPTLSAVDDERPHAASSQASLHAKTFAIDGERVLVGSMNLDPRSDLLNTEMGILIDSPELAQRVEDWREADLPRQAWRLTLKPPRAGSRPRLHWMEARDGGVVETSRAEPEAGFWRRMVAGILRLLPIEKQL